MNHEYLLQIFSNQYVSLALTFAIFFLTRRLQRRTGWVLFNPILITIVAIIAYLKLTGVPFETYRTNGALIEFWLKPAVVALGVPLYLQLEAIKRLWLPIVVSQLVGCLVGVVSVVLTAKLLGASQVVIVSLASKSVTTPIAMEVTQALNGIPSLTAAIVIVTGIIGSIFGFKMLAIGHVNSPIAQGLSMGTASHAVGASTAMDVSSKYGAFASLGITLNGIFTALLTPSILKVIGII
ncbi:TIGR00659 family protein [Prevotella sp. DNF00663]|uniref:LrgB family protein n=1 Tax=unclassified Prevotella TaxID=2638335 RepID=UPI000512CCB8|nr:MULTISPECIES: LrgB family protein [unclassified Prevotella]KGI60814.1 membrane protein [Prevotella sp. S7 MS 2]KXB84053.1 TIGR00659 family protein [Prevotella sp. DNF00663]